MINHARVLILIPLAALMLQGCSGESGGDPPPNQASGQASSQPSNQPSSGDPTERSGETPALTAIPTEPAARLDGWPGVNNLFKSGRFYFAGQPDEESLVKLIDGEGVRTVINIRTPAEESGMGVNGRAIADERGTRYETIPVSPSTFSAADVDRFAEIVESSDGPILVHCASSNRVGGLWAAYLTTHHGISIEQAIEIGRSAGLSRDSMVEAARRAATTPAENPEASPEASPETNPESGGG